MEEANAADRSKRIKTTSSSTALSSSRPPAIAFDIDGVFKAGRYFFSDGLKALALAKSRGCPVCFVTNGGGGLAEAEYLSSLKKKICDAASIDDRAAIVNGHVTKSDFFINKGQ